MISIIFNWLSLTISFAFISGCTKRIPDFGLWDFTLLYTGWQYKTTYYEQKVSTVMIKNKHFTNCDLWLPLTNWSSQCQMSTKYAGVFLEFNGLTWEVIARFADIAGMVNHHCWNFLFIISCFVLPTSIK
jgi:hypothetical protein